MAEQSPLETVNLPDAEHVNANKDIAAEYAKACRPHRAPDTAERERLLGEIIAQSRIWASRTPDVTEEELTDMIDEAIRAVRSQRR
jgi:RecB family exonuclease